MPAEDDEVAGVEAREAVGVEHADVLEAGRERLPCLARRGREAARWRDRAEDERVAARAWPATGRGPAASGAGSSPLPGAVARRRRRGLRDGRLGRGRGRRDGERRDAREVVATSVRALRRSNRLAWRGSRARRRAPRSRGQASAGQTQSPGYQASAPLPCVAEHARRAPSRRGSRRPHSRQYSWPASTAAPQRGHADGSAPRPRPAAPRA